MEDPNLLDFSHLSIWSRAQRKRLRPIKKEAWKVIGRTSCPSHWRLINLIFLLQFEPRSCSSRLPVGGDTRCTSLPRSRLRCGCLTLNSRQIQAGVKRKTSFPARKAFSAALCTSFYVKMTHSRDKTAAAASSTVISYNLQARSRFFLFFVVFSGFEGQLTAFTTTKRMLIGSFRATEIRW